MVIEIFWFLNYIILLLQVRTVIYGSSRRHSNSSKAYFKESERLKYIFMTISGLAESFKTVNRPDPA